MTVKQVALKRKALFRHSWLAEEWCKLSPSFDQKHDLHEKPSILSRSFAGTNFAPFGPMEPVPPCVREAETSGFCDRVKT